MDLPELGIGLTYHPVLDRVIQNHAGLIQVLEIEPQTHWVKPDPASGHCVLDYSILKTISEYPCHKLMHSIGFPIGGSRLPDEMAYDLHREMIDILGVPWMSEHLSFNKAVYNSHEYVTGFMLPPLQTAEGVQAAVRCIEVMKSRIPIQIAVETGVNYLRTIPAHLSDGLFVAKVTEQADCGILLDLHNLLTNQLNGRQSMDEFLSQIPLDRVWELHVAGGKMRGDFYIDSHSGKVPEHLLEKAEKLIPSLPNLGAIIFEMFPDYVADIGTTAVKKDLEYLNRIWDKRKQKPTPQYKAVSNNIRSEKLLNDVDSITPAEWENSLAALVTNQTDITPFKELNEDPAIGLIRGLIHSFRSSMVSESFRYTARLLMISLGIEEYEKLLANFWKQKTPEPFASAEGENFIRYIESNNINVFGLDETIAFERAYINTLMDGQDRVVPFSFDPLSFMKALGDGRMPEKIYEGNYELAIEGGEPMNSNIFHHQAVVH
jgi:uncharacterized protein